MGLFCVALRHDGSSSPLRGAATFAFSGEHLNASLFLIAPKRGSNTMTSFAPTAAIAFLIAPKRGSNAA